MDINNAAADGSTPIFMACGHGWHNVVKVFIKMACKKGIYLDVNLRVPRYKYATALYIACDGGHVKIVKTLLKAARRKQITLDIDECNENNTTPLYIASQLEYVGIIHIIKTHYRNRTDAN